MIKHIRIDNRLIHGQVSLNWMDSIGADVIIVCNDEVANDSLQKEVVLMAARKKKAYVLSIDETIGYAKEHDDEKLFVICRYPSDALALVRSGLMIDEINVGNAAAVEGSDYVLVTKSIAVTAEDAKCYRQIAALRDGNLYTQLTTINDREDFIALLEKNGL